MLLSFKNGEDEDGEFEESDDDDDDINVHIGEVNAAATKYVVVFVCVFFHPKLLLNSYSTQNFMFL